MGLWGTRGSWSNCLGWQPALGLHLYPQGVFRETGEQVSLEHHRQGPGEERELEGTPVAPALPSDKSV